MKRFIAVILFLFLISTALPADAHHIPTWNTEKSSFQNKECQKNNSCGLKNLIFNREDFALIRNGLINYATRMFMEYETDSIQNLTNYGIVQFIRGCIFNSRIENGAVFRWNHWGKPHFGDAIPFHFIDWIIDSQDKDPLYPSSFWEDRETLQERHYYYKWNPKGFHDGRGQKLFGEEKPPYPRLYVSDIPSAAFLWDEKFDEAQNISLEFKTCIYKTTDVPRTVSPDNLNFAEPIHCFRWASSFIYNHELERFETKKEIDPFCREPLPKK